MGDHEFGDEDFLRSDLLATILIGLLPRSVLEDTLQTLFLVAEKGEQSNIMQLILTGEHPAIDYEAYAQNYAEMRRKAYGEDSDTEEDFISDILNLIDKLPETDEGFENDN